MSAADVLDRLGTSRSGLDEHESADRLRRDGPNVLTRVPPASALQILLSQLKSVVTALLGAAVVISMLAGDLVEALAIAAVIAINVAVGFFTELRARRAIEALVQLDVARAVVVREGRARDIAARDLVAGDVVEVEAGRQVPADGRLLRGADLRIDEAPLTGESVPVTKSADSVLGVETPLAERTTMVFKGTTVVAGVGRVAVTATGTRTEVGRIGVLVRAIAPDRTPLERQLDALGRRLVWLTLAMAAAVVGLATLQGLPAADALRAAIALAVAAVPEALPAVATIALAVGVQRMARRQALVRRLSAVESLGSTTVICTDKTRTLTTGVMTVVHVWTLAGETSEVAEASESARRVIQAAALASRLREGRSDHVDPVDAAVSEAARQVDGSAGAGRRLALIPFTSDQKWMAAVHEQHGRAIASLKGAPEAVLARCRTFAGASGSRPLDDAIRARLLEENERLARNGLRVLGVAAGEIQVAQGSAASDWLEPLHGLEFLGLLGLADPPAPHVGDTIRRLREAGLRTLMLTGDQRGTAEAIGRQLDVLGPGDRAIDGREMDRLTPPELDHVVATHATFTRITPEHKLSIVRALRRQGEIVAMLGDGINDAAALRQADVGVAMGRRGTDVAKQAAAIVLQDDRFETIAAAVEEGRVIFDNIRKFVFYLFSCNVAEVLVLVGALLAGWPLPLLPLHLLWLNLVTDTFPALALALEPAEGDVMRRPPRRPREAILSTSFILEIFAYSALITGSTLAAFAWARSQAPDAAVTMAFMTLGLAQILHLGNARSARAVLSRHDIVANGYALAGAGVAIGLQWLALNLPALSRLLELTPLDGREWLVVVGLAALPAVAGQLWKLARGRSRLSA
jgi:Ca2+-transporting ATPase